MGAEEPHETTADRIVEVLDGIHERYKTFEEQVRTYTPFVVRTVEVILAVALFVGLSRWFYIFYFT